MSQARVLLADDHALFREGLAGIIASQPDMEVVGEASDGLEAVLKASELKPDLILMDIQMPVCDGIEATRQIVKILPGTVIVMLTVREENAYLFEAIKNGARGYLLKNIQSRELLERLRGALRGEAGISPALAGRMLEEFRRLSQAMPEAGGSKSGGSEGGREEILLTDREQEVLRLAAERKTDQEIADELFVSLHTVKTHMRNILAKLHVGNRREAAHLARKKGLL